MSHLSLILLPTLWCNADCDYCFEEKSRHCLEIDRLSVVVNKVLDHLDVTGTETLSIYWQGGEVLTLPPDWFMRANDLIGERAYVRKKRIFNYLQSNLLTYNREWDRVISEMFGNAVGSSMDYPNLHRKVKGGGTQEYDKIWVRKFQQARDRGIEIGVIAIPNASTIDLGAKRFFSYFVDELGVRELQVNTPFPGGPMNEVKSGFPLNNDLLGRFFAELGDVWIERGLEKGINLGPYQRLWDYFFEGRQDLLCIWQDSCSNHFICIDPFGNVAQCDCWIASYPEFHFGNIFESGSLTDILEHSEARKRLRKRPGLLVEKEGCIECDFLSICHGGCAVRAYTSWGDLSRKDPYCGIYQMLFQAAQNYGHRTVSHSKYLKGAVPEKNDRWGT